MRYPKFYPKKHDLAECKRCIYDERIPGISFDDNGICNYCHQYDVMDQSYPNDERGGVMLQSYIDQMKKDGKNKPYDVVIGVSGGCDSSYMLHLAKQYGLRVIASHFDNTYNSRTAVENIQIMLQKLNYDLYTHVVDNQEFQRILRSFFLSSVPEIDVATDLALATVHYMTASKYGVKYIWQGHSFRTEGISPPGWFYMDAKYIDTIHKTYGDGKIKTLPLLWMTKWMKWMLIDKIKMFRPLYYIDYNKEKAKKFLSEEYGWQWYGGHHMENRTAYFANNYYLPEKFGIDLRYSEFSGLVRSGQLTREQATQKIQEKKPFDEEILDEIKSRVGFSDSDFERVMNAPPKHYTDFKSYKETFERFRGLFYLLYKAGYITRSFYDKYCVARQQ